MISSGATKKIEYAVDSGRRFSAYTKLAIITMPSTPRTRCSGQRTRSKAPAPALASAQPSTSGSEDRPRIAATWNGG